MISNSTVQLQGPNDLFSVESRTDGGLSLLKSIPFNKNLLEVQKYIKTTAKEVVITFNNTCY